METELRDDGIAPWMPDFVGVRISAVMSGNTSLLEKLDAAYIKRCESDEKVLVANLKEILKEATKK